MPSYWDSHPDFNHDPHAPIRTEFRRLAVIRHWGKRTPQYRDEWAQCCVEEFGEHYGRSERLEGWQSLCGEVGITDVPTSIKSCKKILNRTWVNLVDLIDCRRTGQPVKRHASCNALREYSRRTKKIFPKARAKANVFLAALLIVMF
ncbi:hypothetical protein BKA93DRAFT_741902 [Sparassis latifolia]